MNIMFTNENINNALINSFEEGFSETSMVQSKRGFKRGLQAGHGFVRLMAAAALVSGLGVAGQAQASEPVGVVLPMLTSPFWQAYNKYIPKMAAKLKVDILAPLNSDQDPVKQITDVSNLINLGAKGLVVAPLDSAAVRRALDNAAAKNIPVVAVDVAPTSGKVAMVVRADNVAYGTKSCQYLGEHVKTGKVVQIMGDLASVNGRDRAEAFRTCMKQYPNLQVLEIAAGWKADAAAAGLDSLLSANPDVKGIYMHAGGVYLSPTLQTLRRKGLLYPVGDSKHIVVVSNDGIPQEYDAIRKGEIDATISQPADLYAMYGLYYAREAMKGTTFKPGPTDHGSTIVEVAPGILEDQLPAPVVTRENVDNPRLWANQK